MIQQVVVLGAGISGLSCANQLAQQIDKICILEKSRSLGGRCATRTWRGHRVDHGAQYVTAEYDEFFQLLRCDRGWRTLEPSLFEFRDKPASSIPRFYNTAGNNFLGRQLAEGVDVRFECQVERLIQTDDGRWQVGDVIAEAVVISAPLAQAERLLGFRVGEWELVPCLTAFCAYRGAPRGECARIYAKKGCDEQLTWTACENHKTGRVTTNETILVLQAGETFSQEHLENAPEVWAPILRARAEQLWGLSSSDHLETWTHRWRFARYTQPLTSRVELPRGIFLTGDGLRASRIEDAWLAGRETAGQVLNYLQTL